MFLLIVAALAVGAILVIWPQRPSNYFPGGIPLPGSAGIHIDFLGFKFDRQGFRLGLDLQGGTHLVLQTDTSRVPEGTDANTAVDGVQRIIERRINAYGVAEPIVQRQGADRIIVELPGVRNIEEAKNLIGKTAQLDFCEKKSITPGQPLPAGRLCEKEPLLATTDSGPRERWFVTAAPGNEGVEKELTGTYLKSAAVGFEQGTSRPKIDFEWNGEGARMFEAITTRLKNKQLGIFLDGEVLTNPEIREVIRDRGQITGTFTLDEARNLVIQLNAGALPLPVSIQEERTVDATLGADSVRKSVMAGEIGLLVVALFMLLYYRMLGMVAIGALLVYTLLILAIFKLVPVTLTLAGIAGFILSIGMAVDANVLIFERMKEELRAGKTVGSAIDAGFGRAWTSIRDSNVSALITCAVLYWFGSNFGASIIQGFALTLAIGILLSMFSAVAVSKSFLRAAIGGRMHLNRELFGLPGA